MIFKVIRIIRRIKRVSIIVITIIIITVIRSLTKVLITPASDIFFLHIIFYIAVSSILHKPKSDDVFLQIAYPRGAGQTYVSRCLQRIAHVHVVVHQQNEKPEDRAVVQSLHLFAVDSEADERY